MNHPKTSNAGPLAARQPPSWTSSRGKTTAAELARSHDLTVAEVEQWMDDFVSQGTEALRSHPRDAEAAHKSREKELLAKIGELTMEWERSGHGQERTRRARRAA